MVGFYCYDNGNPLYQLVTVYFLTTWNFCGVYVYILKDAHQYSLACLCSDCILHAWLLNHSVLHQITAILTLTMGYHKCILQTTVLSVYVNYWVSILHSYVVHVCHFPFNSYVVQEICMHVPFSCTTYNPPCKWTNCIKIMSIVNYGSSAQYYY